MKTSMLVVLVVAATACRSVPRASESGPWSWVAERDDNGYLETRGGVHATRAEAQKALDSFLRSNPEFAGQGWLVAPSGAELGTKRS